MRKISILKHKIIRAYHNEENWKHSEFKGYPKGTYYGYESLDDCIKDTVKSFIKCYGKGLRKVKFHY